MDALDIPLKQKARLQRVADLLLVIYKTLVEMRYLEPSELEAGPHDVSELLPLYESHGLAPAVIYLYSILPYVRRGKTFFQGGEFADFRNEDHVERGRDPLCNWPEGDDPNIASRYQDVESDDEDEDGDEEGVNADDDSTGVENANDDGSGDEGVEEDEEEGYDDDDADSGVSDMEEEDGDDEDEDDDDEVDNGVVEEDGTIAQYDARSAAAVLRDINRWYRNHETPFLSRDEDGAWRDKDEDGHHDVPLAELYKQHGWPDDFDGDAFEVALERRHASARVKSAAEWTESKVISLKSQLERLDQNMEPCRARVASAETPGEQWTARWELFCGERGREDLARRARGEEELCEREFPGGQ